MKDYNLFNLVNQIVLSVKNVTHIRTELSCNTGFLDRTNQENSHKNLEI